MYQKYDYSFFLKIVFKAWQQVIFFCTGIPCNDIKHAKRIDGWTALEIPTYQILAYGWLPNKNGFANSIDQGKEKERKKAETEGFEPPKAKKP